MAGEEVSPPWFDHIHHFLVLNNTALSVCEYAHGNVANLDASRKSTPGLPLYASSLAH